MINIRIKWIDFDSISNNDWHTEDLYVRIKVSNEDESIHVGMIGVIQSISVSFLLKKKKRNQWKFPF